MIWTPQRMISGQWPFGKLQWSSGKIEVQAFWTRAVFTPGQVVEMRFYRWPIPTFKTVIFTGDGHSMVSFCAFRGERMRRIIEDSGFRITKHCRWNLGVDENKDMKTYGLLESGGS